MRVETGYHSYTQQRQASSAGQAGFADMLAATAAATAGKSISTRIVPAKEASFFSDPAIVAAMQTEKPVAANYPAKLTAEQTEALRAKYDLEHMRWPSRESAALGEELFALGVIDDDRRKFFYGAVKYTEDHLPIGVLTPAGETPPLLLHYQPEPGDSMIDILLNERKVQQANLDFMKSLDTPEKRERIVSGGIPAEDRIAHLEQYMEQYQSVYDILRQIAG